MPQPAQTGPLAQRLAQVFGLHGKLPLALDEVIVPVVLVSDVADELQEIVEFEAAGAGNTETPPVGTRRSIFFHNPKTSDRIIRVTRLSVVAFLGAGNAQVFGADLRSEQTGSIDAVGAIAFTDTRVSGSPIAMINRNAGVSGGVLTEITHWFGVAHGESTVIPLNVVLVPGSSIVVEAGADDTSFQASFFWTEQQIET